MSLIQVWRVRWRGQVEGGRQRAEGGESDRGVVGDWIAGALKEKKFNSGVESKEIRKMTISSLAFCFLPL
jgi:hypothetical protein